MTTITMETEVRGRCFELPTFFLLCGASPHRPRSPATGGEGGRRRASSVFYPEAESTIVVAIIIAIVFRHDPASSLLPGGGRSVEGLELVGLDRRLRGGSAGRPSPHVPRMRKTEKSPRPSFWEVPYGPESSTPEVENLTEVEALEFRILNIIWARGLGHSRDEKARIRTRWIGEPQKPGQPELG